MNRLLIVVLIIVGLSFPCFAFLSNNPNVKNQANALPTSPLPLPPQLQHLPQIPPPPQWNPNITPPQNQTASQPQAKSQLWNLQDVDIRTLINQVSKETGKNFIIDPRVQGKVTFISNTPLLSDELYQVFLAILNTHGYAATTTKNAVRIVPIYEANYQPVPTVRPINTVVNNEFVVQVAAVQNLSASQLATTLRPLLPPSSQIIAYPQTNSLIISGPSDKMTQIDQIIKGLDQPTASNIEIIPLHYAIASQVVATLKPMLPPTNQGGGIPGQTTAGGGGVNISADVGGNSILISGPPVDRERVKSIIKQMDVLQSTTAIQNTVQVIQLKYLKATDFAPVLINLVNGQSSAGATSSDQSQAGGANDTDFTIQGLGSSSGGYNTGQVTTGASMSSGNSYSSSGSTPGLNLTLPSLPLLQRANAGGTIINTSSTNTSETNPNNIQIVAEETTNSLVISAPLAALNKLKTIIKELDVQPQQVLIEAIIVEVDESVMENLGIQWGATLPSGDNMQDSFANMTGAGVGVGVVDFGRIRAIINYITTNSSSNILSTPSLVVLNNQKAQILVGQQVSFVSGQYSTTGTTSTVTPFTTTNQQNVALTLNVIPQIGPNGSVRLLIKQGNQTLGDQTINQNPVVNEADLVTSIIMKSDQILVLGGLISNDYENTTTSVPLISKIPILGEFFKNRNPNDVKKNLMVFLHPVILDDQPTQDAQSSARYGMIRELELQKQRETAADNPLSPPGVNPLLPQWKPVHIPEPYPTNN